MNAAVPFAPDVAIRSRTGGVVYTPEYWADWAVREFGLHRHWMEGRRVLDPGCGRGSLTLALIRRALAEGMHPGPEDLERLTGIDTDGGALEIFRDRLQDLLGPAARHIVLNDTDVLSVPPAERFHLVLANPPWITFGDLDAGRKERCRPLFRASGLTPNPRDLLLGGSRIDLAALFVITALDEWLTDDGEACFFLPLSLFRSEGAHDAFRRLPLPGGGRAALTELRELEGGAPFPGAGTRCAFARYRKGRPQTWPVPWHRARPDGDWEELEAWPVDGPGSPLIPRPPGSRPPRLPEIRVPEGVRPRQGANTGGATGVFVFEHRQDGTDGTAEVVNRRGESACLPSVLLHPLMSADNFRHPEKEPVPGRWIFLPYHPDGRILDAGELRRMPGALEWLERHSAVLKNRKGSLMKRWTDRGYWWALMGLRPYAFAPWKVAWESYGRRDFRPVLFGGTGGGVWQGNQALHAYLPFTRREDALEALEALSGAEVTEYLQSLGGAGTRIWAQPGRIRRLLSESVSPGQGEGKHVRPGSGVDEIPPFQADSHVPSQEHQ